MEYNKGYYKELFKHTSLHPHLASDANYILDVLKIMPKEIYSNTEPIYIKFKEYLTNIYMKRVIDNFLTCNKSALLLPTSMAREIARMYQYSDKLNVSFDNRQINVGKDEYNPTNYIFFVYGNIPPYIMRRIKYFQITGIFGWKQKLAAARASFNADNSRSLQVPTMSGNVLVIFIVLLFGLCLACFSILLENWRYFVNKVLVVVRVARNLVHRACRLMKKLIKN